MGLVVLATNNGDRHLSVANDVPWSQKCINLRATHLQPQLVYALISESSFASHEVDVWIVVHPQLHNVYVAVLSPLGEDQKAMHLGQHTS